MRDLGLLIFVCAIILAIPVGYIKNVIALAGCSFHGPSYKAEVLRTIGVFVPPIGAVEGYLTITD